MLFLFFLSSIFSTISIFFCNDCFCTFLTCLKTPCTCTELVSKIVCVYFSTYFKSKWNWICISQLSTLLVKTDMSQDWWALFPKTVRDKRRNFSTPFRQFKDKDEFPRFFFCFLLKAGKSARSLVDPFNCTKICIISTLLYVYFMLFEGYLLQNKIFVFNIL